MTREDAFLAAILESPEDDVPRLLYADWLEECGDPRGEFIRVQCQLARHPLFGPRDSDPRYFLPEPWESFRRRERELLEAHGYGWVPGVFSDEQAGWQYPTHHAINKGISSTFRRGFVESVTMTAADWLQHADAMTAAVPIREVTLTTRPVAERVGTHRGYTPYGCQPRGRWRLPNRRREVTSGMSAARVGRMLLAVEWPRIKFMLPVCDES